MKNKDFDAVIKELDRQQRMTVVEWLIEQLEINNYISENAHWLIDEAKEMEKQQLENCAIHFTNYAIDTIEGKKEIGGQKKFEQYYNETFNKI